jgi:beta-lactamase regulating signal transducer with metallopeptidase domain/ABC-type glycerol-3-phosphate transport system substrate-binding protein
MFDLFMRLVENSIIMSVAIVVLYVLSRLTRSKIPPKVRYACWILVAVGLLLPVRPALLTIPLPVAPVLQKTQVLQDSQGFPFSQAVPNPGLTNQMERMPETDIHGNVLAGVYREGNDENVGTNYSTNDVESENSTAGVLAADGLAADDLKTDGLIICDSALGTCGFHAGVLSADSLTTDCLTAETSLATSSAVFSCVSSALSSQLFPAIFSDVSPTASNETPGMQSFNWRFILPTLWGIGALFFLFLCAVRHIRFMKKIHRWAVPCSDAITNHLLDDVCRELGLRHIPQLLICPLTATPIITGLTQPVLILPDTKETPNRTKLIILHEALHIKRYDNWVRVLSLAATAAHWFNPLVYLMNRALHTEAELACDSDVLRYAGDEARAEYSRAIFSAARKLQKLHSVLASALTGEGKSLKRRLANIIERKHTRRGLAIFLATIMIGGVLVAGMVAYESTGNNNDGGFTEDIGWLGDGVTLDENRFRDEFGDEHPNNTPGDTSPDGSGTTSRPAPRPPSFEQAPVDSPIVLEPTNELIIYLPAHEFNHSRWYQAVNVFRSRYPGVVVRLERVGQTNRDCDAYIQRVSTELMAGMGPDIILTHFFDDIHKTMDSGMFLNLSPLWHRDESFVSGGNRPGAVVRSQLHAAVMDAGLYKGRRYVIPVSFRVPILISEREILESVGFNEVYEGDIISFLNALTAVTPRMRENPLFRFSVNLNDWFDLTGFYAGIPFADFERERVLPEEEALRAFTEAYKPFWGLFDDFDWWEFWGSLEHSTGVNVDTHIRQGSMLFYGGFYMPLQTLFQYSRFSYHGETPVLVPLRNPEGEIIATVNQSVAVNANSPNYANAWNFIKILLEQDIQFGRVGSLESWGLGGGIPVNMLTFRQQAEGMLRFGEIVGTVEGAIYHPELTTLDRELFMEIVFNVTDVTLPNRVAGNFYVEAMEPFFRGERSLDESMDELRRRLRIYLSE